MLPENGACAASTVIRKQNTQPLEVPGPHPVHRPWVLLSGSHCSEGSSIMSNTLSILKLMKRTCTSEAPLALSW